MASTNLEVIISATDRFSATAGRITGSLNSMNTAAGRVSRGVGQVAGGLARLGSIALVAAGGGLLAAAKAAGSFEAQMNTINTIARVGTDELAAYGDGIRSLARQGRGDLADLTAGFYDILSAGVGAGDALNVLDAASTLALGSLSTNAEAVDLLTTAINAYGQEASMAGADADLFAKAVELGKVKASEIAASFANVAPVAAQMGIGIEEIAAAYAALTAQGTPAAEVATQMQRAILDLLSPNKELLALQKATGQSFMEMAEEDGLVVALQAMRDAVGGDEQAFKDLFGRVEGYKFALQTTGPQQEKYNAALSAMGDSAGTAAEQMGERSKGLAFAFGRLQANLTDALISVGSGFTPALERMADRLSAFLDANRDELVSFGKEIGHALDGVNFDSLLGAVRDIARVFRDDVLPVLRTAFDLFRALPGPIQGVGAALAIGANTPLVGGAVGQIGRGLGNIGMGLLGGAASKAGVGGLGRLMAQPVFVTNWPMGGIGGGVGGAAGSGSGVLGTVAKVLIPAAVIATAFEASGLLDQRHRNPETGQVFRGTNVASEQLAFQQSAAARLKERIAGGETGLVERQLAEVEAEIARLSGQVAIATATESASSHNAYLAQQTANTTFNRIYGAVEANRAAILAMPPPQVTVTVNVSGRSVQNSVTAIRKAGSQTRLQPQ